MSRPQSNRPRERDRVLEGVRVRHPNRGLGRRRKPWHQRVPIEDA